MHSPALSKSLLSAALPLRWKPIDPHNLVEPPHPWPLLKNRFNGLLYDRVRRFWTAVVEDNYEPWLTEPVATLGESFRQSFDRSVYPHKHYGSFCTDTWLDGVEALVSEFGPDFSPILWDTIASLGTRENPLEEDTILNVQGELPYAWGICDAALHALGKTYALFLHVEERLRAHSGHVLMHDCGCSHALQDIFEVSGSFPLLKDAEAVRFKMKKAWLDHFMGELYLMFVDGLPFRMNPEDFNSTKVIALKR